MRFVRRVIAPLVDMSCSMFPAVVLTGPRRAGKTALLRHLFPKAAYVLLEDPDIRLRAKSDPRGLLDDIRLPALFDEIQNVPELFDYIRSRIDQNPRVMGQWLFTGSQESQLMVGVSESMAGRAAVLPLLPLSAAETSRVNLLSGGYPEVVANPAGRRLWFSSYIQTYLERDVRSIVNVRDLGAYRRFLSLLAARHGAVLNRTELSAALGLSVPTISDWLHVLEVTGQIILSLPYFENFGKRLIKSPRVYIGDSGMACHLLGISTAAQLDRSPFLGAIWEGYIASEILKSQVNQGRRKELYYFRDQQGLEVDFLFPRGDGALWMVECKAAKTVHPSMARPMLSLRGADAMRLKSDVRMSVVHRPVATAHPTRALAPGVEAIDLDTFIQELNADPFPFPARTRAKRGSGA